MNIPAHEHTACKEVAVDLLIVVLQGLQTETGGIPRLFRTFCEKSVPGDRMSCHQIRSGQPTSKQVY